MKKIKTIIITCVLIISLTSICLAQESSNGFQISNITKQEVIEYLVKYMLENDYLILKINDSRVSFKRDADNDWAKNYFGSKINAIPEERVVFKLDQSDENVQLSSEYNIVTNPNSKNEKLTPVTDSPMWQSYLEIFNQNFNGYIGFGMSYIDTTNGYFKIFDVFPGSNADEKGLLMGDLVYKINNKKTSTMNLADFDKIVVESDSISLVVIRDGKLINIKIDKGLVPPIYQRKQS